MKNTCNSRESNTLSVRPKTYVSVCVRICVSVSPIACKSVCLYMRVGETETTTTTAAVVAIGTWNLSPHVKTKAKNSNYMH